MVRVGVEIAAIAVETIKETNICFLFRVHVQQWSGVSVRVRDTRAAMVRTPEAYH